MASRVLEQVFKSCFLGLFYALRVFFGDDELPSLRHGVCKVVEL